MSDPPADDAPGPAPAPANEVWAPRVLAAVILLGGVVGAVYIARSGAPESTAAPDPHGARKAAHDKRGAEPAKKRGRARRRNGDDAQDDTPSVPTDDDVQ
jgi:hypothetical protein